ncbi:hypothetical protein ACWDA7_37460 [Streptomyces sp. NPDC001156]
MDEVFGKGKATYAGHPLYYYAGDHAPGDTNGQGIDGIWYTLNAHGAPIKTPAPAAPSTQESGNGGYGY